MSSIASATSGAAVRSGAQRAFGRFSLQRLLGKSVRTMAWQVGAGDDRDGVLVLPRQVPPTPAALDSWLQRTRKAARLDHPGLARAVEIGVHDGWPYLLYDLDETATLADRVGNQGLAGEATAALAAQLLQALAYVHDAGLAHRDVQAHLVLVSDKGIPRLIGLEAGNVEGDVSDATPSLRIARAAAEADVLQLGILLHLMLVGQPALDEPDAAQVAERLPPLGRELLRLPFTTPRPIAEPLRVIVNRATDRQERQRYRSARTLARALEGWLQVESGNQGGPLALLLDKIRIAGVLPAFPGGADKAARLALMERGRNDELAQVLLDDVALAFDLLRAVNTALVRGNQLSGNGAVLTVRRSIALLGLDGVRRVALALRPWPGPLQPAAADELGRLMQRSCRAARTAVLVRPAGYDGEVVYLVALLQNLGRLVVQYHLADEAQQIRRLMQPAPADEDGKAEEPGMSEAAAAMAVLGVDLEAIGTAVARWWGLDEGVLHLMRRPTPGSPVRAPDSDDDQIRLAAACGNEAVDALSMPAQRSLAAMQVVVQRYGRTLGLSMRDLQAALQGKGAEDDAPGPAGEPGAARTAA